MEEKDAFGKYSVAITGLAGRYPESGNIDEFWSNLMSGTEMCVADDRRWPIGYCKLPEKSGKIPNIDKFDGDFFNYTPRESDLIDAQFRILHEVAFEAILDSGNDPTEFQNKKMSVFTGWCYSDCESSQMEKAENIPLDFMQNCASRLSLNFGFKGPISSYDTACASSFTAFHEAVNAMRNGICETALVCGVTICLRPYVAGCFQSLQMIGKDGRCKCLDVNANGYVRSEAVVAILLQRKPTAKRIYAQVLNTKTNTDGYKDVGITFPSADSMLRLMTSTFDEVNIDPVNIKYIEGHVTGTQAGDPVECEAITKVFCPDYRPEPLLIGCMKSNMGHSEGSSGVCSVSKSALIFQRKMIPPNINYVTPNPNIDGLVSGKLKPVLEPTPFNEEIIALNSFGFGGANVHTIIKSNPVKESPEDHVITGANGLPRLVLYKSRTREGFEKLIQTIQSEPVKVTKGFLEILSNVTNLNGKYQLPFKSFIILDENKKIIKANCSVPMDTNEEQQQSLLLAVNLNESSVSFPADLLKMDAFKTPIEDSLNISNRSMNWLLDDNANTTTGTRLLKSMIYHVSLIELLKSFGVKIKLIKTPTQDVNMITLLSLLTSGTIKFEDLISFFTEIQSLLNDLRPSPLASPLATADTMDAKNNKTSSASSCNGNNNVRKINGITSNNHNSCNGSINADGRKDVKIASGTLKPSFDTNANLDMMATFLSYYQSKYQNNNNMMTHDAIKRHGINDTIVDLGVLTSAPKEDIPHVVVLKTSQVNGFKFNETVQMFNLDTNFTRLDMLHLLGTIHTKAGNGNLKISHLYPKVSFPVPVETASISPLIKWDHSVDRLIYRVPEFMNWRLKNKPFDINLSELFTYAAGHVIDDRILFPAAGYLWLIWQSLAIEEILQNLDAYKEKGVQFRDVKLHRATIVPKTGSVRVTTCINSNTGWFEISDSTDTIICSGYAKLTNEPTKEVTNADIGLPDNHVDDPKDMICGKDFYKELRVRGYEYKNSFQGVTSSRVNGSGGYVNFLEHWVCFCDAVLQLFLLASPTRELVLPTGFDFLQCDIKTLLRFKEEKEAEIIARDDESKRLRDEEKRRQEEEKDGLEGMEKKLKEEAVKPKTLSERIKEQEAEIKEKVQFKVNVNHVTSEVSTVGFYLKGMKASPAPRKKQNAMLRNISFEPFDTILKEEAETITAKDAYMNECRDVLFAPNGTVSKTMASLDAEREDAKTNAENKGDAKTDAKSGDAAEEEEEKDASRGLLNKLIELNGKQLNLTEKIEHLQSASTEMSKDVLTRLPTDAMSLEHLLYVVSDNFYEKELDVCEVNLSVKSSVSQEIKETLNNLRIKCKYTLAEDVKPEKVEEVDATMSVSQFMKNKMSNANLTILQHPSTAFTFLQDAERRRDANTDANADAQEVSFDEVMRVASNQLDSNAFLLTVSRIDVTQLEKDIYKPKDGMITKEEEIIKLIASTGLIVISRKIIGNHLLILSRKPTVVTEDDVSVIETETFNHEWVESLKSIMFEKEDGDANKDANDNNNERKKSDKKKIWIKGDDFSSNGLMGFIHCLKKEDHRVRGVLIQGGDQQTLAKEKLFNEVMKTDLLLSVYKEQQLGTYLSRPLTSGQLIHSNKEDSFLDVESKGDLSSLKYYNWSEKSMIDPTSETYLKIHYSALNFKDVMVASGRVPIVAYPESFRNTDNGNLGMEFSGTTKDGTKIMGFVATNAIATGIDVKNSGSFLWNVPSNMSLEEAATIPVVYSTVYYALIMRGKLRSKESILIHAGSGGVGQAAINVCLSMGCEVFTTCGSQEKRDFIKSHFGIADDHIFNSRSTNFADDILLATNGRGVDVVLNSLADEKLVAGITCLADSGRFVEIGKYDLISDHLLDPKSFAMNQTFEAVCLAYFMEKVSQSPNDPQMAILRDLMDQGLKRGIVKPLARHVFNKNQAEEAFRMMATGKHTGKVLLKMTAEDDSNSASQTTKKITFNANKSYIVVGGLGGFGLEICYWLVKKGARKIIITSRSGPKSPYHRFCIERLEHLGAKVVILRNDVSILSQAADLIEQSAKLGPVGGIFNTAMVLKDAFFENQTKESFEEVCAIKIKGTDNLDQVTRIKCPSLDHFICFSSLVASKGNLGQSNYAFANSSMDLICENRHAIGLPGLSIQWGVIGDVGHVAEFMGNETIIAGSVPQRIISCLDVLEKVMSSNDVSIIGSAVEVTENMSLGSSEDFVGAILNVLGLKDASSVDPNSTLGDLGLDSLMAVEIKQLLEKNHDIILSTKEIRELKINDIKEISKNKKTDAKLASTSSSSSPQDATSSEGEVELKLG